jgi:hypothetical protein
MGHMGLRGILSSSRSYLLHKIIQCLRHSSWSPTFMQRLTINFHEYIPRKHVNMIKNHGLYSL